MGKITDISVQKHSKKRANIFIDGVFACGLELITVYNARLEIGDEIESEQLERIQLDSERNKAFDKAVGYLSRRIRSEKEMRRYLYDKQYLPTVIDSVINSLKDYGYVDDRRYAAAYVADHRNRYGIYKLKYELGRAGVDNEIIAELFEEDEGQEEESANLVYKYMRRNGGLECKRDKVIRYMSSKGFDYYTVKEAYDAVVMRLEDEAVENEEQDDE